MLINNFLTITVTDKTANKKRNPISRKDNNINMPKLCVYILLTATLRNNPGKAGRSSPQLLVQQTTLRL